MIAFSFSSSNEKPLQHPVIHPITYIVIRRGCIFRRFFAFCCFNLLIIVPLVYAMLHISTLILFVLHLFVVIFHTLTLSLSNRSISNPFPFTEMMQPLERFNEPIENTVNGNFKIPNIDHHACFDIVL